MSDKIITLDNLDTFKTKIESEINDKQDKLTTSSVSSGTINQAVGFDSQGNLVRGTLSQGITFVEVVNGYSGSIVSESNEGAISYNTYIKFDNAPTSASDYDAYSYAYNGVGYVYGSNSYSGKTKVYAWGNSIISYLKVGNTTYVLEYETGMGLMPRGYDNPLEITLTENVTITLGCGSGGGGGDI